MSGGIITGSVDRQFIPKYSLTIHSLTLTVLQPTGSASLLMVYLGLDKVSPILVDKITSRKDALRRDHKRSFPGLTVACEIANIGNVVKRCDVAAHLWWCGCNVRPCYKLEM